MIEFLIVIDLKLTKFFFKFNVKITNRIQIIIEGRANEIWHK